MMNKYMRWIGDFFEKAILYIFLFIICYILFANTYSDMARSIGSFVIVPLVITIYIWRNRGHRHRNCAGIDFMQKSDSCFWLLILVGVALRMVPILFDFEWILIDNQGDSAIHFFGSQQLASGEGLSEMNARYEAIFPQLYSYTLVLSLFFSVIKNIELSICLSNIIFDCIAIVFLSKILNNNTSDKRNRVYVLVWWLNPIFIIMCWFSMAIIAVNAILLISLYFGCQLIKSYELQSSKMYRNAVLLGISIFVGNLFRPMFSVLLIAEIVIIMIQFFKRANLKLLRKTIILTLLFVAVPLGLGKLYSHTFVEVGGFMIPQNKVGWNFFVGANYESSGTWSPDDNYYFHCELLQETDIDTAENILFEKGMERYQEMSISQLGTHVIHKANVLFSNVGNSIRDLKWVFRISDSLYSFLRGISICYYITLLVCLLESIIKKLRNGSFKSKELLIMLSFIGFSMAYLLVEVMSRYITIPIAMLILVLGLYSGDEKMMIKDDSLQEQKKNGGIRLWKK